MLQPTPQTLGGFTAWVRGRLAAVYAWPIHILGVNGSGNSEPIGVTSSTASSVTLTFDANPTSGDTFTIGGQAYRVMTTMTQAYDIKRAASAALTLDNIKAAINGSGTAGTEYFADTLPNPKVLATTNTDTTQLFVARRSGVDGNEIAATETFTSAGNVFGSATLTGGTNAVLNVATSPSSSPTAQTLSSTTLSASGNLNSAGARQVVAIFSSDFAGTVDGQTYTGATIPSISFTATPGYTLPAIPFTRSAGSVIVHRLT